MAAKDKTQSLYLIWELSEMSFFKKDNNYFETPKNGRWILKWRWKDYKTYKVDGRSQDYLNKGNYRNSIKAIRMLNQLDKKLWKEHYGSTLMGFK